MSDLHEPGVLIVEDQPSVAEQYEQWLSDRYRVSLANDGRAALDALDGSIDVVVIDREISEAGGTELLREIRRRNVDVTVVIVAAEDPGFDAIEAGFDASVGKPVDADALGETIDDLLDRAEADQDLSEYHSLMERKGQLEADLTPEELEESDEYGTIREDLDAMEREVDEKLGDLDSEMEFVSSVREVAGPSETFEMGEEPPPDDAEPDDAESDDPSDGEGDPEGGG